MTTPTRCPTVWALPFGAVRCGDVAERACEGCGTRYCAGCLYAADICDGCLGLVGAVLAGAGERRDA